MDTLDLIYLMILFISIPFGHIVKTAGSPSIKRLLCFGGGMVIVLILVGWKGMIHSFIVVLGNFVLVQICGPRFCHSASFFFVFGYLLFYRLCASMGFPAPPKHSNAVQLLVTLRMINLAFEYHDANERKESKDDSWEKFRIKKEFSASLFDYFAYGYCYIGLMTGPFYTYQTFQDMLYQDGKKISTVWPAIRNLKYLPVIAIPYLVLKSKFPLEYLESEECLQQGMIHTLLVMVPVMAWFRWRFYIGWLLAESMCMSAGLGAYPFECKAKPGLGPTYAIPSGVDSEKSAKQHDGDTHDFATTHNIEIFHCEYSGSLKSTMKIWNMTVQWWMATYIYKRLPIKSNQIRMVLLLAVSAYWHGLHAGYYASFLSAPLFIFAETRISQRVTPYLSESQKYWWSWLTWFFVFRYLEYIAIPFMFLKFEVLWKIWSRIYFCGHVWTIALVFISMLIPVKKSEKKSN